MDWLKMQQMQDEATTEQQEDGDKDFEVEVKKPKRKRRKTTGDSPSATPQLHTQTISQVWSIRSGAEEEGARRGPKPRKGNQEAQKQAEENCWRQTFFDPSISYTDFNTTGPEFQLSPGGGRPFHIRRSKLFSIHQSFEED
jgi:hypothetical protein